MVEPIVGWIILKNDEYPIIPQPQLLTLLFRLL